MIVWHIIITFIVFVKAFLSSNITMIGYSIRPLNLNPLMIKYPMHSASRWETLILAHMITLTPGTCTVDMQSDHLLVHAIHSHSESEVIAAINQLHTPLKQVMRS